MPTVRTGDIETYYEISGSGDPVLLLHGLGSSTRDWEYNQPEISRHYKTIAYDARGHGQTEKAPGPYSVARFARDADALLEHLDCGPVHLVGMSMGGMTGFQLALDSPHRVRSLSVVNSGPQVVFENLRKKLMLHTRLFIVRVLGMRMVGRKLAGEMFPDRDQEELRSKVIDRWSQNSKRCYLDSIRALVGWSVADRLEEIQCPVLEIRGDHDDPPASVSDNQLTLLKNARRVVVSQSRHATPVDQPEKFNQVLLDFLRSC